MKFKLVPPRQGMLWVRHGLQVFFQRPAAFCLLLFVYMLVGWMLFFSIAPLATAGFMIATRQALQGRMPLPSVFLEPLRSGSAQRWAQLKLAVAYLAGVVLVVWLVRSVGASAFQALDQSAAAGRTAEEQIVPLLSDPSFQLAWWVGAVGFALLAIPFWHAPALVHWGGQSAGKALFFSVVACWRNRSALVVYMLGWCAVMLVFAVLSSIVLGLLGAEQLALVAVLPAALMLTAAFYASLYFTFADSFEPAEAPVDTQEVP